MILAAEDFAVTLDPLLHRAELRVIDGLLEPVLERLAANGATITPIAVQAGRRSWRGADCMRMAKRLLGLSPWAAAAPIVFTKSCNRINVRIKFLTCAANIPIYDP